MYWCDSLCIRSQVALAGQHHDGRPVQERVGHAGDEVRSAGPEGREADAGASGEAAVRVGHERRPPARDAPARTRSTSATATRWVDGLLAGNAEDVADALGLEARDDELRCPARGRVRHPQDRFSSNDTEGPGPADPCGSRPSRLARGHRRLRRSRASELDEVSVLIERRARWPTRRRRRRRRSRGRPAVVPWSPRPVGVLLPTWPGSAHHRIFTIADASVVFNRMGRPVHHSSGRSHRSRQGPFLASGPMPSLRTTPPLQPRATRRTL